MKVADIRAKTDSELGDQLTTLAKERFNLRFQKASGQLENPACGRNVRRQMAQVATVLNERKRGVKIEAKAPVAAKPATKTKKTKAE